MRKIYALLLCTFFIGLGGCAMADPATPHTGDDLMDISWTLVSLDESAAVSGSAVTLVFMDQNSFGGYGGCNNYSGSYQRHGDRIEISPQITATMRACMDQNMMAQEQRYFQMLPQMTRLKQQGDDVLILKSEGGQKVEFRG